MGRNACMKERVSAFIYSMKHMPENKKCGGASMRGQFENSLGTVSIDSEVVATYAGSVAVECFGIVGMAAVNMKDGLVKLLKKDYLHHGISVKIEENNRITLEDRKSTRLNSSHTQKSRMPSSA